MIMLLRSVTFRVLAILAFGALFPAAAQAQTAVVTGRVMSDQGHPLAGANVAIDQLGISVATNEAGVYTITIPPARMSGQTVTIRARAIGYTPVARQLALSAGSVTANFDLTRDVTRLSEVVVTGVATATEQRKLAFTVTRMDSSDMPVTGSNPVSQIQGKVPGAIIVSGGGRPGSAPSVVLRGPVSLNASGRSQQPLYLLDGIPLQGSLPEINPDDIQSVEVVKGAAAASLYGARAGAGVINLTTKSGRNAAPGVRFGLRTEVGQSDIEKQWPLARYHALGLAPNGMMFCTRETAGGSECARYIDWDAEIQRINNSGVDFSSAPQGFLWDFGISRTPTYDQATGQYVANRWPEMRDPVDQAVTPNTYANTNLDMRAKVNNTGVYASLSNFVQQGSVEFVPGFVRNSARVNVDQTFGEDVTATITSAYSQSVDHASHLDETGSGGPWFNITRAPWMANLLARDDQGRLVVRHNPLFQGEQNANPLYIAANNRRKDRSSRFVGGATVRYNPLEWLSLESTLGYDRQTGQFTQMRDRGWRTTTSAPATSSGFIGQGSFDNEQWNTSVNASARRTFFTDLDAILTTRYVFSDQALRSQGLEGIALALPGLETADAATQNLAIGSTRQNIRDMGFFYGVDLDYKDRYILGALLRRDGSSLFGAGNRWQTFGRVSAAWLVSEEPWWFADRALSLFKLRASRGSTGQRPRFSAQYETFTIGTGGTLNPAFLGNRNLKPEINTETEIGADLEIFSRYGLNVSYAKAVIDQQILPVPLAGASGFQQQWQNAGEITNQTWEATLNVPIITRGSFNWSSRLIWDQTRSVISRLDIPEFIGRLTVANTYDVFKFRQGERLGTIYGFDFVRNCSQLPAPFNTQCSMNSSDANAAYRPNSQGFIVWVGQGNQLTEGITRNLWRSRLEAGNATCLAAKTCTTPWGNRVNWGMPITQRDSLGNVAFVPLGNGIPKFHWGMSHNVDIKRLSLYALLDASVGHKLWNTAYHWSLGDFQSAEVDQAGKSVEEARPLGYYWRRGSSASPGGSSGVGGLYDVLNPHGHTVEDASYVKLREISLSYLLGSVGGFGNWRVGVIGRNVKTWSDFRSWDPETGVSGGELNSAALNPVVGFRFPNLRTWTLQVSSSF